MHTGKFWMGEPGRAGFTDDMGPTGRHGGRVLAIGRKSMKPIYDFMDKTKREDKPFFVGMPRSCRQTPPQSTGKTMDEYAGVKNAKYAKYLAMIEWLDETCGELMDQLKKKGVADNTLLISWPITVGTNTARHLPTKMVCIIGGHRVLARQDPAAQGRARSRHEYRRSADDSHGLLSRPRHQCMHQFARR